MADVTFTVTVPDAWVSRVQAAIGASTKAEAETWVKQQLKRAVISHEANEAEKAAEADVQSAREAQEAARIAAIADADTLTL